MALNWLQTYWGVDTHMAVLEYKDTCTQLLERVKNCRPFANASNCQVWEEGISEDFHTTCKVARMTLRVMPLLVRDGSAQLKRDLGEPHTKVEFGPLGQRKATLLANSVWSSLRHLQNEPSRRDSRCQKGLVQSLQGRHPGCRRERGLGNEG